eukprot:m.204125 g.204125  ORF g.204125 m.204125 type:complete len:176 (-) comp32878_c0_seq1:242-769(-)
MTSTSYACCSLSPTVCLAVLMARDVTVTLCAFGIHTFQILVHIATARRKNVGKEKPNGVILLWRSVGTLQRATTRCAKTKYPRSKNIGRSIANPTSINLGTCIVMSLDVESKNLGVRNISPVVRVRASHQYQIAVYLETCIVCVKAKNTNSFGCNTYAFGETDGSQPRSLRTIFP